MIRNAFDVAELRDELKKYVIYDPSTKMFAAISIQNLINWIDGFCDTAYIVRGKAFMVSSSKVEEGVAFFKHLNTEQDTPVKRFINGIREALAEYDGRTKV